MSDSVFHPRRAAQKELAMFLFHPAWSGAAQAACEIQWGRLSACAEAAWSAGLAGWNDAGVATRALLAARDGGEWLRLASQHSQHAINQVQAFSREASDMAWNKPLFR
jgi:hypothetical protein